MSSLLRIDNEGNLRFNDMVVDLSQIVIREDTGTLKDVQGNIIDISAMLGKNYNAGNLANTTVVKALTADNANKLAGQLPDYYLSKGNYKNTIPVTATPALATVGSVVSQTSSTLTISNFDSKANYVITSNIGTLSSVSNAGTFTYTAPDITSSTIDTVVIFATKAGEIRSSEQIIKIPLIPLHITSAAALINPNFSANGVLDIGFKY